MAGAVVLIGFMGAGKTSAARTLDPAALDTDAEIERRAGCSIPELFAQRGEGEFRALEEQVALELLDAAQPGTPVALGGGTLGSERVRTALDDHVVAYDGSGCPGVARRARCGTTRSARRPRRRSPQEARAAA